MGLILANDWGAELNEADFALSAVDRLRRHIRAMQHGGCRSSLVATGFRARRLALIATNLGAEVVWSRGWREGASDAMRCGALRVMALNDRDTMLVVARLGDDEVTSDGVRTVIDSWRPGMMVRTSHPTMAGPPVSIAAGDLIRLAERDLPGLGLASPWANGPALSGWPSEPLGEVPRRLLFGPVEPHGKAIAVEV